MLARAGHLMHQGNHPFTVTAEDFRGKPGMKKRQEESWKEEDFGEDFQSDTKLFARLVEIDEIDDDELADQEEVRRFANVARAWDA